MLDRGEWRNQTFRKRWCSRNFPDTSSFLVSLAQLCMLWMENYHDSYFLMILFIVTMNKSWYLVFSYYSLIIICTQSYLVDNLSGDLMPMWSDFFHFLHLHVFAQLALPIVVVSCSLYYSLLNFFALFLLFSLKHLVTLEFCSESNRLFNDLSNSFIFHHPHDLPITAYIVVNVLLLNLIH